MAKPFSDFVNAVLNKGFDVDNSYGAQCWDGYAYYCQWLGIPYISCWAGGGMGGARSLWECRATNGILATCNVVTKPQNGDIAVWGANMGGGYGHVAMYYNGQYLGQNQGGSPYPTGGACFNIITISPPLGYLRPKPYVAGSGPDSGIVDGSGTLLQWIIPTDQRYLTIEEMQNNAKCFYGYMHVKYNWSLQACCGILGNTQTESSHNPNCWQNLEPFGQPVSDRGFGLVQWTPWTNITTWLQNKGYWGNVTTYGNAECDKIQEELETGQQWIPTSAYPMSFREFSASTKDPGELAWIFLANYERPYNPNQPTRATQAREWYNYLKGWNPVLPGEAEGGTVKKKTPFWVYMKPYYMR